MITSSRQVVLAAVAATLVGTSFATQGGMLLRRQLTEGSTEKYAVEMKMLTTLEMPSGLGEQELGMTSAGEYEVKVGKMNWQIPGSPVETTMKITKMQAEGIMAGAFGDKIPPPSTSKGTLDIYGRLKGASTGSRAGFDPAQMQSMSSSMMFIELPEKAVSVGDSWQIIIPKSPMTKEAQFLTVTLTGEKNGILDVKIAGSYKIAMEPRAMSGGDGSNPMQNQKVGLKGDITVDGTGALDRATGKTLWLTTKTKTKQEVSMPDMGMTINSESNLETSVKLVQ